MTNGSNVMAQHGCLGEEMSMKEVSVSKPGPLCHLCPLRDAPGPVWGVGSANAALVRIGQSLGQTEVEKDEPFVGPSGYTLEEATRKAGYSRNRCFTTNVIKCFLPPQAPVPQRAIECCRPLLEQELSQLQNMTTILTIGAPAFAAFTGKRLTTVTNKKDPKAWLRGAVYELSPSKVIIPAVHPAYLGSTQFRDLPFFEADVAKAVRWATGGGHRIRCFMNYNPTAAEVLEYVDLIREQGNFALDVEYPMKAKAEGEDELEVEAQVKLSVIGLSANIGEAVGVRPDQFELLAPLFSKNLAMYTFNHGHEVRHLERLFGPLHIRGYDVMLALNLLYSDAVRKDLGLAMSLFTDMPFTKNLSKTQPDYYNWADTTGTLWAGRESWKQLKQFDLTSEEVWM